MFVIDIMPIIKTAMAEQLIIGSSFKDTFVVALVNSLKCLRIELA